MLLLPSAIILFLIITILRTRKRLQATRTSAGVIIYEKMSVIQELEAEVRALQTACQHAETTRRENRFQFLLGTASCLHGLLGALTQHCETAKNPDSQFTGKLIRAIIVLGAYIPQDNFRVILMEYPGITAIPHQTWTDHESKLPSVRIYMESRNAHTTRDPTMN